MHKIKSKDAAVIDIPAKLAKKLALKEGMVVEAKVEKGKLVILGKRDKIKNIMQYAGIWEKEKVDEVFHEIRGAWGSWQRDISV